MTDNPQPGPEPEAASDAAAELAALKAQLDAAHAATAEARAAQAAAIAAMREALRAAHPSLPPALIDGSNPTELLASIERAQAIRDEVLAANPPSANGHTPRVPAGGQATGAPDTSAMSPAEKIRFALSRRGA